MDPNATVWIVNVLNTENNTRHVFGSEPTQFLRFKGLLDRNVAADVWGDGVDSAAVMGMTLLFDSIPHRFPVKDILIGLRDSIDPDLPLPVVEAALMKFARTYGT